MSQSFSPIRLHPAGVLNTVAHFHRGAEQHCTAQQENVVDDCWGHKRSEDVPVQFLTLPLQQDRCVEKVSNLRAASWRHALVCMVDKYVYTLFWGAQIKCTLPRNIFASYENIVFLSVSPKVQPRYLMSHCYAVL
ncbi:hypothetical protein FKM82_012901 [Ascaphus truei]